MTYRRHWTLLVACALLAAAACSSSSKQGTSSSTTTTTSPDRAAIGTVAESAWRNAAQGTFRGARWTIAYARSSGGWLCYDVQGAARAPANASGPSRKGRATTCLPPRVASSRPSFTAFVAGSETDQYVVVGAVTGGVKAVHVVFGDKSATSLNVDPHTRLVVWKGPASLHPAQVRTDATACALDPSRAPGSPACTGVTA